MYLRALAIVCLTFLLTVLAASAANNIIRVERAHAERNLVAMEEALR